MSYFQKLKLELFVTKVLSTEGHSEYKHLDKNQILSLEMSNRVQCFKTMCFSVIYMEIFNHCQKILIMNSSLIIT